MLATVLALHAGFARVPHENVRTQEVQSARETADETVSRLEAELDSAEAVRDAAAAKLQVGPHLTIRKWGMS